MRRRDPDPITIRNRRIVALGTLIAAALLVIGIVVSSGGGSSSTPAKSTRTTAQNKGAGPSGRRASTKTSLPAKVPSTAPGAHRAPTEPVPILMYHVINRPPAGAPNPELYVPAPDFAAEMKALQDRGYHAVTMQQLWDAWHSGGLLPSKPVVVSFDDGYHGIYANALPVMQKLGWPGTLNLELRVLDQPEEGGLQRPEVRALIHAGWEVDSHTLTHPDLTTLSPDQLRQELEGSRAQLKQEFDVPANFFCYPAGRFDQNVIAAVKQAGYLAATTTEYGLAKPDNPYELARVRVNASDGVSGFVAKMDALAGGNEAPLGGTSTTQGE